MTRQPLTAAERRLMRFGLTCLATTAALAVAAACHIAMAYVPVLRFWPQVFFVAALMPLWRTQRQLIAEVKA